MDNITIEREACRLKARHNRPCLVVCRSFTGLERLTFISQAAAHAWFTDAPHERHYPDCCYRPVASVWQGRTAID